MGICETCKHWDSGGIFQYLHTYTCQHSERDVPMARCNCDALDDVDKEHAIVSLYDAPTAGFFTGPKFGCIHHEVK